MLTLLRSGGYRARALLTVVVVLVSAVVVLACGGASAANTGTKIDSGSTSTGGQTNTTAQHFKVGDQVKVGDTYVVSVNSVKTSAGSDIDQPKAGNDYLIVDVTIKNVSSQEQNFSSDLQFTLKDSTGQKYTQTIISNATPPDGKIAAGDLLRGQMAFEVPTSQKNFTLAFESDIFGSGQTIWDLKA